MHMPIQLYSAEQRPQFTMAAPLGDNQFYAASFAKPNPMPNAMTPPMLSHSTDITQYPIAHPIVNCIPQHPNFSDLHVRLNTCVRCGICLTCPSMTPNCGCKARKPQRGGKTIPNSGGRLARNPAIRDSRSKSLLSNHPDHDIIIQWLSLNAHPQFRHINFWQTSMVEVSACKTCDSSYNRYCKKMRTKRRAAIRMAQEKTSNLPRTSPLTPPTSPDDSSESPYPVTYNAVNLWKYDM